MVDIAFLLLIFFMVTTVFRQPRAIELNVPDLDVKVAVPETNVLTVFLGQGEATYYKMGAGQIRRVTWDSLFDTLRQQAAANPNLIILVKIDRQAYYERMVNMMDDLEDAHLERFSLAGMSPEDVKAVEAVK
jgi:biopolymer transport protein ExbD